VEEAIHQRQMDLSLEVKKWEIEVRDAEHERREVRDLT
jgi:hypothetical protein